MIGYQLPAHLIRVPIIRQMTPYSCGAACLLSIAQYWGAFGGGERKLAAMLGTSPEHGTTPWNIHRVAGEIGLYSQILEGYTQADLANSIIQGDTLIVNLQAWPDNPVQDYTNHWPDGHYVVAVAFDAHNFYFMDPSIPANYGYVPRQELDSRWHDIEDGEDARKTEHMVILIRGKTPVEYFEPERIE